MVARIEPLDHLERIGPSATRTHENMDSLSINQNEWKNRPFLGQVAGLISYTEVCGSHLVAYNFLMKLEVKHQLKLKRKKVLEISEQRKKSCE